MEDLLASWGVSPKTIEIFIEQGVDVSCLEQIEDPEIRILIPDNQIRDRIKFISGRRNYLEELKTLHSNTDSLDTDSLDNDSLQSIFTDKENGRKTQNKELNLLEILSDNINGRQALNAVKERKLDPTSRNNLVKGVIDYYLKTNIKLTKTDFESITEEIVKQCPKECKETYYVPSRTIAPKVSIPAKGKLVDRYYNQLRALRCSGVYPKKRKLHEDSDADSCTEFEKESVLEVHTWLKYNRDPWPEVEEKWNQTCEYRKKTYTKNKRLSEFVNEWPCLRATNGYRLIEIDFRFQFTEREFSLLEQWDNFFIKCTAIMKMDFPGNNLIKYLNDKYSINTQTYAVLALLVHKIKPTSKILDSKGKHIKISHIESQEAFVTIVENYSAIDETLKNRRKCYDRKGLTCQPLVVCVGTYSNLESVYVVIDDIKYQFQSLTKALDTCFKCLMVFDLAYPKECEQLWLFIQQYFYNIHLISDKKFSQVTSFIKELTEEKV